MPKDIKVVVLSGGYSPERDVSLVTGSLVAAALRRKGYPTALVDVYMPFTGDFEKAFTLETKEVVKEISTRIPNLEKLKEKYGEGERLIGRGVIELCRHADIIYNALHGGMGEDGRLQALFTSLGMKYTGSKFEACHVSMDKSLTKAVLEQHNIPTAKYVVLDEMTIPLGIKYPCVIKPCSCGSSVGVSFAENEKELRKNIEKAFKYDDKVIIEDKLKGREFTVAVLFGDALPIIEIIPKTAFYDYERKYQAGATEEICPAPLTKEQETRLKSLAVRAFFAMRLTTYSRFDFILDEETNEFYCLEGNALPGMTNTSLVPLAAKTADIQYDDLCEKILLDASVNREVL